MTTDPPRATLTDGASGSAAHEPQSTTPVNPLSALAQDYLGLFDELVSMLERLPGTPELIEDLLAWRPIAYQDYFQRSPPPGQDSALAAYDRLDSNFKRRFERFATELDTIAVASVAAVRLHYRGGGPQDLDRVAETCARGGKKMRAILTRASRLVNYAKYGGG